MMEDESLSLEGKGLLNMRVVDLKLELEKRGLSKSGSKKDLVKRLKQQLEFEKLCEERKSGDFHVKLELDAKTQENEFVQQYLAQQQKRYAEREEEKRLELEALQKCQKKDSTISCEHQSEDENASSNTDNKDDEKQNLVNKPLEKESQSEYIDGENVARKSEDESAPSDTDDKKDEKQNLMVNKPSEKESESENTGDENVTQKSEDENAPSDTDDKNNEKQNLMVNKPEKESQSQNTDDKSVTLLKSVQSHSKDLCISECESKFECLQESFHSVVSVCDTTIENQSENPQQNTENGNRNITQNLSNVIENEDIKLSIFKCASKTVIKNLTVTEHSKETDNHVYISENIDDAKKMSHFEENTSNMIFDEDLKIAVKADDKLNEPGKCQSISSLTSEEIENTVSYTSPERTSSDCLPKQKTSKNMEVSDCTPVPYSLSDIQLPESPGSHMKSEDTTCEERNKLEHGSDEESEKSCHLDKKKKANGKTVHNLNSSREENMSESETKDSSYSNDSPEKMKKGKRHSDESSDGESDRNGSPYKKKSFKYEDTSSNLAGDSDNDHSRSTLNKEKKFVKTQRSTDKSDNEKSTDSEKYNRRIDSKRKSRDKRRKRDSRSSPSSSSRSRSSDSSSERKHSKKLFATKSKNFAQDDESNQMNDKSSDEKPAKDKKSFSAIESSADTVSVKKRLKIKRDNIPIELISSKKESLETSTSTKTLEKNSSSHSTSVKPTAQESVEEKEEKPEINYKPRKVVLSNRKLNRKSSESNNAEPRSKKSKWESFASGQKSSHTYSISTDSLRNWFPDFKLVSETSIEMEQDEHSLPAIDEKNEETVPSDTLNENESSMKQESTSQLDTEDSVSHEPHSDEIAELGPASKIIFIQNLVRPFTLNQLKNLLKQNGKIVEEYFWIDKIKSKCFVMYESEKDAIKARNALNNTRWPSSNPKILSVEFSSIEELEKHQKGSEQPPSKPPEPPAVESSDPLEARLSQRVDEHKRKDREHRKEKDRAKFQAPVREWDKDKIVQDSPERERPPKEEKARSAEKKEKKESKKRANEDTPAKLLDDLFQKTKSVPCIYWLPLTEEQAKAKEEERKMKKLERERRNQQLREQEETERRSRRARSSSRRREKENRKSSTRSRSPASRRR